MCRATTPYRKAVYTCEEKRKSRNWNCEVNCGRESGGMEPMTGIGPAYPAWKAGVLPLNYIDMRGTNNRERMMSLLVPEKPDIVAGGDTYRHH